MFVESPQKMLTGTVLKEVCDCGLASMPEGRVSKIVREARGCYDRAAVRLEQSTVGTPDVLGDTVSERPSG